MKNPHISSLGLAVLTGISLVSPAFAVVNMSWTSIGDAGNAPDTTGYGSVDHAYNIEWNDAVISGSSRGQHGGSWYDFDYGLASSDSGIYFVDPSLENFVVGFRVASVPEPTSVFLAIFGSGVMLTRRKR